MPGGRAQQRRGRGRAGLTGRGQVKVRSQPQRTAGVQQAPIQQHVPTVHPHQFISPQDGPAVLHIHPVPVEVEERGVDQSLTAKGLSGYMHTILFKPNPPWGHDSNGIPQGFLRISFNTLHDAMNAVEALMPMFQHNWGEGNWCPEKIEVQVRPNMLSREERAVKLDVLEKRMSGVWNPDEASTGAQQAPKQLPVQPTSAAASQLPLPVQTLIPPPPSMSSSNLMPPPPPIMKSNHTFPESNLLRPPSQELAPSPALGKAAIAASKPPDGKQGARPVIKPDPAGGMVPASLSKPQINPAATPVKADPASNDEKAIAAAAGGAQQATVPVTAALSLGGASTGSLARESTTGSRLARSSLDNRDKASTSHYHGKRGDVRAEQSERPGSARHESSVASHDAHGAPIKHSRTRHDSRQHDEASDRKRHGHRLMSHAAWQGSQDVPHEKVSHQLNLSHPRSDRPDRPSSQRELAHDRAPRSQRSRSSSRSRRSCSPSRLSNELSRKRPRGTSEQVWRSVPDSVRHPRTAEPSGLRQQRHVPESDYNGRHQVDSSPTRRLRIGAAAQVALGSRLSEHQVTGSPVASLPGRTPFEDRGAARPSDFQFHPRAANAFAAQRIPPSERCSVSISEPFLSPGLPSPQGAGQAVGVQGMDALQNLPAPALNALLNIVDQSPALMVEHFNGKNVALIMRLNNTEYHTFLMKASAVEWSEIADPAPFISSLARQAQR
ncbi:hypothetical protein WJX74_001051 [Apatococcus lobatus]|uniref:Uncharacterized protein n=1 Tax=Apatococcus lobatus TaxID=904363 RepID=A0AAW1QCW8_9CHLO